MKRLYCTKDTRRDIAKGMSGLDASIKKWQSIADILAGVDSEAGCLCGLCLTAKGRTPCVLAKRSGGLQCGKEYDQASDSIGQALEDSRTFLGLLKRVKEGECQSLGKS